MKHNHFVGSHSHYPEHHGRRLKHLGWFVLAAAILATVSAHAGSFRGPELKAQASAQLKAVYAIEREMKNYLRDHAAEVSLERNFSIQGKLDGGLSGSMQGGQVGVQLGPQISQALDGIAKAISNPNFAQNFLQSNGLQSLSQLLSGFGLTVGSQSGSIQGEIHGELSGTGDHVHETPGLYMVFTYSPGLIEVLRERFHSDPKVLAKLDAFEKIPYLRPETDASRIRNQRRELLEGISRLRELLIDLDGDDSAWATRTESNLDRIQTWANARRVKFVRIHRAASVHEIKTVRPALARISVKPEYAESIPSIVLCDPSLGAERSTALTALKQAGKERWAELMMSRHHCVTELTVELPKDVQDRERDHWVFHIAKLASPYRAIRIESGIMGTRLIFPSNYEHSYYFDIQGTGRGEPRYVYQGSTHDDVMQILLVNTSEAATSEEVRLGE